MVRRTRLRDAGVDIALPAYTEPAMHFLAHLLLIELIPLLWMAWVLYWYLGAGTLKPVARRESGWQRASHFGPIWIAVLLFVLPDHRLGILVTRLWPGTWTGYFIGVALVVLGLGFSVLARLHLGANWSAEVTLKQDHSLVRSGPYRWLRHPIYTGLLVAFAGSAVALDQWRGVLALLIMLTALVFKLRREERWMTAQFGAEYVDYRRASWALVPFVW